MKSKEYAGGKASGAQAGDEAKSTPEAKLRVYRCGRVEAKLDRTAVIRRMTRLAHQQRSRW